MTRKNIKKHVTFNLNNNKIIFYDKYIHKHKYKTKYNYLFTFLYKNISDSKWHKHLPIPSKEIFEKKIIFKSYEINITYYINKWGKICLYITNNIQHPRFFSRYFNDNFNINDFRLIIINYIRDLCFKNDIY